MSELFAISIDEAHCVTEWGNDFRPEYACLGQLRYQIPSNITIPFHIVSATLAPHTLQKVLTSLRMRDDTVIIRRSNDRSNLNIIIEEMQYPANGWLDIDRVLKLHTYAPANSDDNQPFSVLPTASIYVHLQYAP